MSKVYGYTICQPSSAPTEKLESMLYRPVLGYKTADEAIQNAQRIFNKVSNITSQPQKYSVAIYSVDSDKIPDFKPFPKIYNITEDIRNQLNIEEHATYTPFDAPGGYIVNRTTDTELVQQEMEAGKETIEQRRQEREREIQEKLEKIRQKEEREAKERIAQQERERIPKNAVGIKLVPMEQAAQPGWQPEKSPSNMDIWIKNKDEVMKTCAHMLIDMQQKREIAQKSNVFHAIHDQHMRPIDAQEKYGQPQRYIMPALAVLYDSNKQPTDISIPSWEEMQTSLSENNFRSASLLSADINDALAGLWMQAKIKAFDTQYKYPLPDNYQPPIISTIDENTKTPIVYEHYGNTRIDPEKTRKVGTNFNLKPDGGLWACAQNEVGQSWHSFTKDWRPARDDDKFVFELSSDAKILKIDSIEAIAHLQQHYPKDWV